MRGFLSPYNLQIGIKVNNVKNLITKNKDKTNNHNKPHVCKIFIPDINNSTQEKVSIGSTKRYMITRYLSITPISLKRKKKNTALGKYRIESSLQPIWVKNKTLHNRKEQIKAHESILIICNKNVINKGLPYPMNNSWKTIL